MVQSFCDAYASVRRPPSFDPTTDIKVTLPSPPKSLQVLCPSISQSNMSLPDRTDCMLPDCPPGPSVHTARLHPPARRCTSPDCPYWPVGAQPPPALRCILPNCPLPARRCIPPDGPCQPVGASDCHCHSPFLYMARRLHRPVPSMLHAISTSSSGNALPSDSLHRLITAQLERCAPLRS